MGRGTLAGALGVQLRRARPCCRRCCPQPCQRLDCALPGSATPSLSPPRLRRHHHTKYTHTCAAAMARPLLSSGDMGNMWGEPGTWPSPMGELTSLPSPCCCACCACCAAAMYLRARRAGAGAACRLSRVRCLRANLAMLVAKTAGFAGPSMWPASRLTRAPRGRARWATAPASS